METYDLILIYEDRVRTFPGEKSIDTAPLVDMKAKGLLKEYEIIEH